MSPSVTIPTSLLLLLAACAPVLPAEVCFTETQGLGRDASGALCPVDASPIAFSRLGPNVQLLVDRSGSMAGHHWGEVLSLTPYLPFVGERANLGLAVFPSGAGRCEVSRLPLVPLQNGEAGAVEVSEALGRVQPMGSTPMAAAVRRLVGAPELSCPNRDNVVVLLTDGDETCGGNPVAAVRALANGQEPVEVYVIGFGVDDRTAESLAQIAEAARDTTPSPNFYRASTAGELVERLQQVTGSCRVQLDEDVDADALTVTMDGVELAVCPDDEARCEAGYRYDEAHRTVSFEGADCLAMLDGACHELSFDTY